MTAHDIPVTTGTVEFKHPSLPKDKKCETWYKVFGDLKSSSNRPLVTLHGGPGMGHEYLLPISALASPPYNIPVVFYDQLGTGASTHLRELRLDTSFWTPDLFMAELENLLSHLGISSNYDLLGQSWGGMLGASFAIGQPKGLKRLVLSNSPASMSLWTKSCNQWRKELPREIDAALTKHEKNGTYDDPEYQDAVMYFYKLHLCRMEKWPQNVMDTLKHVEDDDTVYFTMNGPSEFTVIGSLKDWDITKDLHKINVPTLILGGEYDEGQEFVAEPFFSKIGARTRWRVFDGCSHLPMDEKPDKYNRVLADFLMTTDV